jgi:hypothetical protein
MEALWKLMLDLNGKITHFNTLFVEFVRESKLNIVQTTYANYEKDHAHYFGVNCHNMNAFPGDFGVRT